MKTEQEKMLAGEMYLPMDPVLVEGRARCKRLLHRLNVTEYLMNGRSREILAELIPDAGSGLYVEPPFFCDYGSNIHLGEHVYFNVNCVVLDPAPVHIGSRTMCGPAVQIYTATHPLDPIARRQAEYALAVSIGEDCWIGGGAIIRPGVHIGDRCVVGAGSVVTRDVPDNCVVAGNPAQVIRRLSGPAH